MADVFAFSEDDARLLRQLIERERRQVQNTRNRPAPLADIPQAPDVFVVKAPDGGIPALDAEAGTGTGTGTLGYPGSAICTIYTAREVGGYTKLVRRTNFEKRVYNMSEATIPEGSWCLITRDKSGTWWAVPAAVSEGGGGGDPASDGSTVTVQLDADLGSDTWRGYIQEPNGLGYTVGDEVRVWVGRHVSASGYTPSWISGLILLCQVTPFTSSGFTIVFPQRIPNHANLTVEGTVSNTTQSFGGAKHFGAGTISLGSSSHSVAYGYANASTSNAGIELRGVHSNGDALLHVRVTPSFSSVECYIEQEGSGGFSNFACMHNSTKYTGQTNYDPDAPPSYIIYGMLVDVSGNGTSPLEIWNMYFVGGILTGLGDTFPLTTAHIYHPTTAQTLKDFLDAL